VRIEVKVFRTQELYNAIIVFVVDQNSAEKRSLGIDVAGESPF
jgi:hypothetical protein